MGRELRIRVAGDRLPPQIEGLEGDEQRWRLSLETHRDLLCDVAGVEPTDELTLQELVTIRARLEGYVEREKRPAERAAERSTDRNQKGGRDREGSSNRLLFRLLERLCAVLSLVCRDQSTDATSQQSDQPTYPVETVQGLAVVFRAAAVARRREIGAATITSRADAATDRSAAD